MRTPATMDPEFLTETLSDMVTDLHGRVLMLDNEIEAKELDLKGLKSRRGELVTKMHKAQSELNLLLATKK